MTGMPTCFAWWQDQVWTYLIGEAGAERKDAGLMAKLFQEQWYNGNQVLNR